MRAVVLPSFGDPSVLVVRTLPQPEPGPGELRVRVHAAAVAFGRDVWVRSGRHPVLSPLLSFPHILGGEHAGVVDAVGPGVDRGLVGARVAVSATVLCQTCGPCLRREPWHCTGITAVGIQRQGSHAEMAVVPVENVERLPEAMPFEQAAALAASGPLAWAELDAAGLRVEESVLVPGASGAVGSVLVALGRRRGADVIALSRGRRVADTLIELGSEAVLDSTADEIGDELLSRHASGIDVVVDNVAHPDLWRRYWPAVARGGRIVLAGQASRTREPLPVDVVSLYNRRATITGLTVGDPRPVAAFWAEMRRRPLDVPAELLQQFPLERAADAHRLIEQGGKVGHVVVTVL